MLRRLCDHGWLVRLTPSFRTKFAETRIPSHQLTGLVLSPASSARLCAHTRTLEQLRSYALQRNRALCEQRLHGSNLSAARSISRQDTADAGTNSELDSCSHEQKTSARSRKSVGRRLSDDHVIRCAEMRDSAADICLAHTLGDSHWCPAEEWPDRR